MVLLRVSARFEAKVERHHWNREADVHFDDHMSLQKQKESNPGTLIDTPKPDYQTVATCVEAKDIKQVYKDDDHIPITYQPNFEKTRNFEKVLAQHTQEGEKFEFWIKQVEKML